MVCGRLSPLACAVSECYTGGGSLAVQRKLFPCTHRINPNLPVLVARAQPTVPLRLLKIEY